MLRIWSHLLKKSWIENFIFCAVLFFTISKEVLYENLVKSGLKTLSKVKDIKLTKLESWNVSRSIIVGRKNPNIRKRKRTGSEKKNIKTIDMTSSQVPGKNPYSPCQAEIKACTVYISRSVSCICIAWGVWLLNLYQQLLFTGICHNVHFKDLFSS